MVPARLSRGARGALAAIAAGALLAGCGGGGEGDGPAAGSTGSATSASPGPSTTPAPAPEDLAAAVAAATEAAGRARFTMEIVAVDGGGDDVVTARSEGVVDWASGRGHRVDSVDEAAVTTGTASGDLEPQGEAWLVGDRTWEGDVDAPAGEPRPVTGGVGAFLGLDGEASGTLGAALLATLGDRAFAVAGEDEVDGTATTRYTAGPLGEDDPQSVELWADGDDRLRRLRLTSTAATGAELAVVLELTDLGADLDVPPPPAGLP